jgi:hypothetical protein
VSGLFDAAQLPLALMVSADQVPFCFADIIYQWLRQDNNIHPPQPEGEVD